VAAAQIWFENFMGLNPEIMGSITDNSEEAQAPYLKPSDTVIGTGAPAQVIYRADFTYTPVDPGCTNPEASNTCSVSVTHNKFGSITVFMSAIKVGTDYRWQAIAFDDQQNTELRDMMIIQLFEQRYQMGE
jgi:hypothetical protein